MSARLLALAFGGTLVVASCTSSTGTDGEPFPALSPVASDPTMSGPVSDAAIATTSSTPVVGPATVPVSTAGSSPVTAAPVTTTHGAATPEETTPTTTVSTTTVPTTTPYVIPIAHAPAGGWGDTHSGYPATDIFENGCGNGIVSPVNGSLLEVRRVNGYDPNIDNPATRGGRSIAILGDDGVRYYLAHFELIEEPLEVGQRVMAGQALGTIGTTGRSGACHVHFGISPPCPDQEWSVRRGVVWPYVYLNDWKRGGQLSPVDEIAAWVAANPNACADAAADPFAPDA